MAAVYTILGVSKAKANGRAVKLIKAVIAHRIFCKLASCVLSGA